MIEKDANIIKAFLYTLKEYKKFNFKQSKSKDTDDYDSNDYRDYMFRLLLLRKYFTKSDEAYIVGVIKIIKKIHVCEKLIKLEKKIEQLLSYDFNMVTSDGTKLSFYKVVEDVMYGSYLHADLSRIIRMSKADEKLVFITIRKYIQLFEPIILGVYELIYEKKYYYNLTKCCIDSHNDVASVIKVEDEGACLIEKNNYYKNISGKDATIDEVKGYIDERTYDIMEVCKNFLDILKLKGNQVARINEIFTNRVNNNNIKLYKKYFNVSEWGFSSHIVDVNCETVKLKLLRNADSAFIVTSKQIISSVTFIYLKSCNKIWKIDIQ